MVLNHQFWVPSSLSRRINFRGQCPPLWIAFPRLGEKLCSLAQRETATREPELRCLRDLISTSPLAASKCLPYSWPCDGTDLSRTDALVNLDNPGFKASFAACASFLRWCGQAKVLSVGKGVHEYILKLGLERDLFLGSLLVHMYDQCGAKQEAFQTFDSMHERNVFSWNFIIKAYAQELQEYEASRSLDQMQQEGVLPNNFTFISILSAYSCQADLHEARRMHIRIKESGFELDIVVGTALLNMYAKCGSLEDAHRIFEILPEQNVVSWTAMMAMYAHRGLGRESLQLYEQMKCEGVISDKVTFVSILAGCSSEALLDVGRQIHVCILDFRLESDVVVGSALINLYGKCGKVVEAKSVFDQMPSCNVVSWTAMIAVYTEHEDGKEALRVFHEMQSRGFMPNNVTFVSILSAYNSKEDLLKGKQMHALIKECGLHSDITLGNALVTMYGKCGSIEDASRVFGKIRRRDLVSWNAMIAVYADHKRGKDALELFNQMQGEGIEPDRVTFINALAACSSQAMLAHGKHLHGQVHVKGFEKDISVANALINMYGKCGSLENSRKMFDKMSDRNVISWTAIIGACAQLGQSNEALQLFKDMQLAGVTPNNITFINVLLACASTAGLVKGQQIHGQIVDTGYESEVVLGNVLGNMYGKCGHLEDAHKTFERMLTWDVVSWNGIIAVYAQHGLGNEVLQLFCQMLREKIEPDKVTFVGILVACSHAGLVDEACQLFLTMIRDHGISPIMDHYICMIDLLGRASRLDEAESLINSMPFQPTIASVMALLSACRYRADVEKGERAVNHLVEMDPENVVSHVMISSMYTATGRWDDLAKLRIRIRENCLEQLAGCCSKEVELQHRLHKFHVDDHFQTQMEEMISVQSL